METLHTLDAERSIRANSGHLERSTDLELLAGIIVECAVIVQNVDEREVVPDANFVIVRIMRGRNLDRAGTKGHINDDVVGHNRNAAIEEGVSRKLAV